MGISEVQICNMALSRLGVKRISALTDSGKAATECNLIYAITRDAVLADHDWGFARIRQDLALLTDTYSGWLYAYAYPSDCLTFRRIFDEAGELTGTSFDIDTGTNLQTGKVEFEILLNSTKTARVVGTDKVSAEGIFTISISDPNLFSYSFVDAFAYRLAADLAINLKGKASIAQGFMNIYLASIKAAGANSANEGHKVPSDASSFTKVRQ